MDRRDQQSGHHIEVDALNAYLDGALSGDERRAIEAHLASCAECRQELAELRTVVTLLHGLPQIDPPVSFQLGSEHARAQRPNGGAFVRLLPVVRTLAVAAMLAFMIASGWLVFDRVGQNGGGGVSNEAAPMAFAPTPAPTSVVAENGGAGGTGNEAQASMSAEDEQVAPERRSALPSSAEGSAPLIDRGDSASTNGAAPDEAETATPQTLLEQEPPLATEAVDTSTSDNGNQWLLTVIGLGLLAAILVGLWILLVRMSRQRRIG